MVLRLRKIFAYPLGLALVLFALVGVFFSARGIAASVATATEPGTSVPILMYHSIRKDPAAWGTYVISPAQLEADLKYLQEHGYHTVLLRDLIAYVHEGVPLPEKPVVLTFDDGYYNNYLYAYPLLEQYDCKAVLSVIGYYTDLYTDAKEENAAYSHCTWGHLQKMSASGRVEVLNHTYHLHTFDQNRKGCAKNSWESMESYTQLLTRDVEQLQEKFARHLGTRPVTFTYPFGSYTAETCDLVRRLGFSATLSCVSGTNRLIPGEKEGLFCMKRYLRSHQRSAAEILSAQK